MSFQELIEKEREQRRALILDTAERLFFARGFDTVTMSEIAGEVGINKATLYIYFENKDHLLFAIILHRMRELVKRYEACIERDIPGREKSRRLSRAFFGFARENADYYRMVCAVSPERLRNTDSPLVRAINEQLERQVGMLRDALAEGVVDGTVRDDLDPLEMAVYLSIMSSSIVCLNPYWANVLATAGIDHERFVSDYLRFAASAIDRPGSEPPSRQDGAPGDRPGETPEPPLPS